MNPEMLLLDEPFSALDVRNRTFIRSLIKTTAEEIPLLMVTHDVRDLLELNPYIYIVEDFRVSHHGNLNMLLKSPKSDFTKEFFLPLKRFFP